LCCILCGCAPKSSIGLTSAELAMLNWDQLAQRARRSVVHFGMWAGDDARNRYFQTTVAQVLAQRFEIALRMVPCADTVELVNKLLNERAAGKNAGGSIDMIWI